MIDSLPTNVGSFPERDAACFFLNALADADLSLLDLADLPAASQCNWTRWLVQQELGPFAYLTFLQNGTDYAPEAKQILAASHWQSVANWAVQEEALLAILQALDEAEVAAILLKGAALAVTVYPSLAARPMGDIDLWIEKKDLAAVWHLMHALGYQTDGLWSDPEDIPDHHTQVAFSPADGRKSLVVEILWDLIMRPGFIGKFPLSDWWARRQIVEGYGRQVMIMDPAAMLQHVSLHQMLQHRGELRLRWLLDVDRLLRGSESYQLGMNDWQLIEQESLAAGILPAVQTALRTAAFYFGTPLPVEARNLLAVTPPAEQQKQFQMAFVPHRSTAGIMLTYIHEARGWRQKTAVVRGQLFPSTAYMRQRYQVRSSWLLPFYYGRRLLKGAWMMIKKKRGRPV